MIIWFTGLSGAGKSTLAQGIAAHLQQSGVNVLLLDGDLLRGDLCSDLGYSSEDRCENIRRAGAVAMLAARSGIISVCSLISPLRREREKIRSACLENGIDFYEVYVSTPLDICEARDNKGLYKKAHMGLISNFTGIDSAYEPPTAPDLEISTQDLTIEESIRHVVTTIAELIERTDLRKFPRGDSRHCRSTDGQSTPEEKVIGL